MKKIYYGWIMVIIAFFVLAMNALAVFGFGVFLKPLTEQFGWERGALSGAFSLGALLTGVLSLVTGRLADRYGPRIFVTLAGLLLGAGFMLMSQVTSLWQVFLIWGFIIGSGIGCAATPTISSIPRWFTARRGITLAITVAGFNFGAVFGPLLIQWIISTRGWQTAFIVMGFFPLLVTIPLAQFMKRDPQQLNLKPYGEEDLEEKTLPVSPASISLTFAQAIRTWRFWVFGSLQFSFGFCIQIIIVHITSHASDMGLPVIIAASILSIAAGSRIIGNLTTGFLSDRVGGKQALSACFVVLTISLIWLIFTTNTGGFFIFAVLFGITSGGIIPLLTLVPADLFGVKNLGIISGTFLLLGTSGGALGAPLAGYIFDISGNYRVAFVVSVIIGLLAIILSLVLLRYKKKAE
ncbi:MFS transporter [Chloroflexota bacterium]